MNDINSRDLGRLEGKMDAVMSGVEALQAQVSDFIKYQHTRNHELSNGIDTTRGEIIVAQREIFSKLEAKDAALRHSLMGVEKRVAKIEENRKADRAFLAGVSAAVSALITSFGLWWKYGGT